jgi:translation initiation factor IF-3
VAKNKYYPVNEKISDPELRVINSKGENEGVMKREEALALAQKDGLDLVVVSTQAKPPVAKILEFRYFLREQKDQERKAQRRSRQEIKQLRFGPNIAEHDLGVRIKRILGFLDDGDKVKITVQFKGRMIIHKDIGREKLERIKEAVLEHADVEKDIWVEGNQMMIIFRPK